MHMHNFAARIHSPILLHTTHIYINYHVTDWFCFARVPTSATLNDTRTTHQADHYAVLGLPLRHFDLTQTDLEARYKNLQRLLHPDKFSTKGQQERTYSDDQASLVNVAYHTLKDPLRYAHIDAYIRYNILHIVK